MLGFFSGFPPSWVEISRHTFKPESSPQSLPGLLLHLLPCDDLAGLGCLGVLRAPTWVGKAWDGQLWQRLLMVKRDAYPETAWFLPIRFCSADRLATCQTSDIALKSKCVLHYP